MPYRGIALWKERNAFPSLNKNKLVSATQFSWGDDNTNGYIYQILMTIFVSKQLESEELLRRFVMHIVTQNCLLVTGKKKIQSKDFKGTQY